MDLYRVNESYCCSFVNSQHIITYYTVIRCYTVYLCNFSIHTQRERERYEKIQTIHIIGGCFSLNHPPTNLTLQHFPGTPAPVWPDVSTLPVYCASCHSQGHVGVSPRSHRTPGIVFLNEANGKSIFVLDNFRPTPYTSLLYLVSV